MNNPLMSTVFTTQTLAEFEVDQAFWTRPGRVVQGSGGTARTLRVREATLGDPNEGRPLDISIVDLGPCRYVVFTQTPVAECGRSA